MPRRDYPDNRPDDRRDHQSGNRDQGHNQHDYSRSEEQSTQNTSNERSYDDHRSSDGYQRSARASRDNDRPQHTRRQDDPDEIGVMWDKEDRNRDLYLSGQIDIKKLQRAIDQAPDNTLSIMMFRRRYKDGRKPKDTLPDWDIKLPVRREDRR